MFNENSGLVVIWARNVREGNYKREQVPKLSNLQEMVYKVLDSETPAA
ncbi:hypothetical protein [Bacillus sp. FJAT-49736]|nr:hypothetical protein [Bacillus sp. FJAT-49736]MBS4172137.1 hypothetical protein [Bacillus sp. FJAT-49736]